MLKSKIGGIMEEKEIKEETKQENIEEIKQEVIDNKDNNLDKKENKSEESEKYSPSKDEVLFKNTSRLNEEELLVFQNYALKKTIITMSIVIVALFAIAGAGLCFLELYLGITVIVAGILGGVVLFPFMMKDSLKKQNKLMLGEKKYLNTFEFFNDYLLVTSEATASLTSDEYKEEASSKVSYESLFRVDIYKTYVFIFINKAQSFVLNQRGMTKGVVEDLIEFLKSKGLKVTDKKDKVDESIIIKNKSKKA